MDLGFLLEIWVFFSWDFGFLFRIWRPCLGSGVVGRDLGFFCGAWGSFLGFMVLAWDLRLFLGTWSCRLGFGGSSFEFEVLPWGLVFLLGIWDAQGLGRLHGCPLHCEPMGWEHRALPALLGSASASHKAAAALPRRGKVSSPSSVPLAALCGSGCCWSRPWVWRQMNGDGAELGGSCAALLPRLRAQQGKMQTLCGVSVLPGAGQRCKLHCELQSVRLSAV